MKRLIALFSTLCLGILILLTSCNKSEKLPNIQGSLDIKIFKTDLSIVANFVDTEEHDLYNDIVKAYITVSSTGEEAKEISRKNVTVTKPASPETNLTSSKLDFTSLTADTLYSVKLVISSKGIQKTLATKEVTTLNTGESEDDPILVDSLDMLLGMNKTKDAYYKLTTDIDCGGTISSIFNSSSTFAGTFDGNGHKIYNLKFDSNQYTGLFGYMSGATVKNLTIEAPEYSANRGNTYLGALAGYAKHCKISDVTIIKPNFVHTGQTSSYAYIGGLVGQAENSTISNCSVEDFTLDIKEARLKMYVGGFVGENKNSKIEDCYVTGNLSAKISYTSNTDGCLYLGGFSGVNDSSLGILNCHSQVDITVTEPESVTNEGRKTFKLCVGGFNGGNIHYASKFNNCASIGDLDITVVYAWFAYVGGFAGFVDNQNISNYENCVYVPKEKGVVAKFAKQADDAKVDQTAYISLGAGIIGIKSTKTIYIIAYRDVLEITNRHDNLTVTDYIISQDLTGFSQMIRDLILNL